ncbi:MAG: dihydroneopterin aldolase [Daejeonella sp.]|uniref:dihydroneopterin aldolase n=1 Tax=Daejeonella sp. TaxID=2805397 RepID=UPI003C78CE86
MGTIRQKVSLEGVRIFAYHGFYAEERVLGTEFIVDVDTELEVFSAGDDELSNTVNYEKLYQIISFEMKIPRKLLETVAHAILDQIRHEFLAVKNIRVVIRKMHPPLGGDVRNSTIEVNYSR